MRLAVANILQKKVLSLISLLAVGLGIALLLVLVGMTQGSITEVANRIQNLGGDIIVQQAAALYAGLLLWPQIRRPRRLLPWMGALAAASVLLIGPQIYISYKKSDSFNPYPSTELLSRQVSHRITLLKFATVEDEGHWRGLTYWSPYVAEPEETKTARFYLDHPARAAFLMLSHAYSGFHYDQIKPYWRLDRARPLTIWLMLSSAIVYLGIVRMATVAVAGKLDADGGFAMVILTLQTTQKSIPLSSLFMAWVNLATVLRSSKGP